MHTENNKNLKNSMTIISVGFSITAILTTIVAVPIGLSAFERTYAAQVQGNVNKQEVKNLKSEVEFSEEAFSNAVNNLKIFDKFKNLSAKTAFELAKNPRYSFNFLQIFDFNPIIQHKFRVVLNTENAVVSGSEIQNVIVYAHSEQFHLTYSKKIALKGFAATDAIQGNLVNYQINLKKSNLSLDPAKSSNLLASEIAFKLDNDFQKAYKKLRSRPQAFADALLANGLTYNLVNNLGLPTILEKGYVLAPKTIENEKAKQEKIVQIGETDSERVARLAKIENLVFKNLDDTKGTLSIAFELIDENGKLVQEFDFSILGIPKLDHDKIKKEVLAKVREFVEIKPLVQLALVRDNLSLAEIVYKNDNNPENLTKILAKLAQEKTQSQAKTINAPRKFQDSAENPKENSEPVKKAENEMSQRFELNREDFQSFFTFKTSSIPIPGLPLYYININSIDFAKNLTQEEKNKLLEKGEISLVVNFDVKKEFSIQTPYLDERELIKSSYSPVLKQSLAKIGKGSNSKQFLLDLGTLETTIPVQLDYNSNQRKLISTVLEKHPEKAKELTKLENLQSFDSKSLTNADLFSTNFEFKQNPNSEYLTLGRIKSLVQEVVESAKSGRSFEEVALTLYFLDNGKEPDSLSELEKYKKAHASEFAEPASTAKTQTKTPPEDVKQVGGDKSKQKPQEESVGKTSPTGNAQQNSSENSSSQTSNTTSSAPANTVQSSATSSSSSATEVRLTKFEEAKTTSAQPSTSPKKTEEIKGNTKENRGIGLGILLWKFLQKSNYSVIGDVNIEYKVEQIGKQQVSVKLIFSPKKENAGEASSQVAFIIKALDDTPDYDFLRNYNPTLFFDFTKQQQSDAKGVVTKISALNQGSISINLNQNQQKGDTKNLNTADGEGLHLQQSVDIDFGQAKQINGSQTMSQPKQDNSKGLVLHNGVILLAFHQKNVSFEKQYLINDGKGTAGLWIKKQKHTDNQEKYILGLDTSDSYNQVVGLKVAMISGLEGELKKDRSITIDGNYQGSAENKFQISQALQSIVGTSQPAPLQNFWQKNVNKPESENFDFIKDNKLLFLTIVQNGPKYNFWLTSQSTQNPYTQKIESFLNLTASKDSFKQFHISSLGPKKPNSSTNQAQNNSTNSTTSSSPVITFKGLAVFDSAELATNLDVVSELTNHFIKQFKN